MSQTKSRRTLAIVGRPNVGKSAIFNRLAGRRIAIVHDMPGVTRDRNTTSCESGDISFDLIDTGGIGATLDDGFAEQVNVEADIAIESADIILFVVDGLEGMTPIDENLAAVLRRSGTPVILGVNKIDDPKHDILANEFAGLGFSDSLQISAEHDRGFSGLRELLHTQFSKMPALEAPVRETTEDDPIKIALVGRPNVGKSSLINAILEDKRTIVSDVAGTTRDSVDVPYQRGKRHFTLIDTAGIRNRTKRDSSVEVFSAMRSERAIRRADLCALVIDAGSGVTSQDRKIAAMVLKENKPCILILNKFDLYHPGGPLHDRMEQLREEVYRELFFLQYAPVVACSALNQEHLGKIFNAIDKVQREANHEINTGTLNRLFSDAMVKNPPPMRKNKRLKLLYITHPKTDSPKLIPVPTYILFVNYPDLMAKDYRRYLEAQIRKNTSFIGLPILFDLRSSRKRRVTKKSD